MIGLRRTRLIAFVTQRVAAASLLLLVASSPVVASPILDQSFGALGVAGVLGINSLVPVAQSFTVGITGSLVQVDLYMSQQGTASAIGITLDIFGTDASQLPTGASLGSTAILASAIPVSPAGYAFVPVTLATSIAVTAGQQLAIVLSTTATAPSDYRWALFGPTPTYAAGAPAHRLNGTWSTASSPTSVRDAQFRTFVDPVPVPEPTSMLLLGTGLIGAGVRRYRQRRAKP